MNTIRIFLTATRGLLRNRSALAIFALLYALLLASLYGFVATREATVWQVVVTLVLLVLIPAEFLVLQSAILTHARDSKFHWNRILPNSVKLFIVTLPMVLLGYALFVLLNKWQLRFPPPVLTFPVPPGPPKSAPTHWPTLLFGTLRSLLFGVALPLATIHLWIEVAGSEFRELLNGGAKAILKRLGNIFARAFAPDSVLIYAIGLLFFAAIPYAVLFIPISVKGTRTAFAFFIAQLVLAFAFTLVGWIITVGALVKVRNQPAPVVSSTDIPAEAAA